jgi:SAM-dependent methyltransferase
MNQWTIDPLARALARLLKPGGRFVFTVLHPCFPSPFDLRDDERRGGRAWRRLSQWMVRRNLVPAVVGRVALRVVRPLLGGAAQRKYLRPSALKVVGPGEPVPHYNFHRPLSALLEPFLTAGLVIESFREEAREYSGDLPAVPPSAFELPFREPRR